MSCSTSDTDSQHHVGSSNLPVSDREPSLARQMLLYVYNRSGIVTARQISFWERFRQETPDVELPARDLRAMFFSQLLHEPEHFNSLDSVVEQYINPRFNKIDLEALEFGDLTEGEDYTVNTSLDGSPEENDTNLERLAQFLSTPFETSKTVPLPPIYVRVLPIPLPTSSCPLDALLNPFRRLVSELLYTNDETVEKCELEVDTICDRVQALTVSGIALDHLLEPKMECYKLLHGDTPVATIATPAKDQAVPAAPRSSTLKRLRSGDDSGLGRSTIKRRRVIIPSLILAQRKRAKEMRAMGSTVKW
ncbi:uncharacterized protein LOC134205593 [Armigeres subalbatus]|uniref:uncharacterized protein LOC134205593 n=1 Tax=Armigeres subalbatus TaxID=124917 RepID=UPI002ED6B9F6